MAEHDSEREEREGRDERDAREPQEQSVPFDEEAAWKAIIAAYGEEPPDPPGFAGGTSGRRPFRPVEDLALPEPDTDDEPGKRGPAKPARPLGSSISFAPGLGPRDHTPPDPSDDDFDEDDEGHFVPPEPPPLPEADATAKFAWLGVIGGPVLLLLAVLLRWDMTWWLTTLSVGGFLGGCVTLVMRMRTDEEDDGDPGRGAVV
ncbi:hypothetical protein AB0E88_21625 [Streptomyces sp. NPDC028635]|uniref:hypothetical protein n=1 Tax=Streptomyces sp. NPDC028635 TaxID=3154800 RepID=UPI00340709EF